MIFEWDEGNLSKLKQIQESGRIFEQEEIESVFDDPKQTIDTTYSDLRTRDDKSYNLEP